MQARKSFLSHKQILMGDSYGNSEDQNADRNVDSKDDTPEVADDNKDSFGNWTRSHECYILINILSTFWHSLRHCGGSI
jgi:hypothetical protein